MRSRTQNKVTGTSAEAGFHRGQQERAQEELQVFDSTTVKVEQTTRGIRLHAKVTPASIQGARWANPPEYDQTTGYSVDEVVIVSSDNPAISNGADAGVYWCVKTAPPGEVPAALPDPATDANGDWLTTVYWVPIGGIGNGGPRRMRVKSVHGSYLTCRTWDGTTQGTVDILVAKPPQLRWADEYWTETVEGVLITFVHSTRTDNLDGKRTASASGKTDQIEIVIPVYHNTSTGWEDDEIWADKPGGGTGVTVSVEGLDVDLIWMDTNRAARAWCQLPT